MKRLFPLLFALLPTAVCADVLVPTRTIRAQQILSAADVKAIQGDIPGMLIDTREAVGQEARVVLYAGRPIRVEDVGPPAIVERNQIVPLVYRNATLTLKTDARALARGGIGDSIRVMNLSSRTTVTGIVAPDGSVQVGQLGAAFK
ncbi:flagellar basal body P-ring formation chaperone FlgA [Aliiroseovarius sp. PTFE2010]|uniref:flagellar basal body P-ring formation chaperone FlgA n=1 Tax=Aliiroseovarius sp. PTFE2010 TaxID=3417190 RepID=UPI003CEAE98B